MMQKQAKTFVTHDGPFHADEVSACALLLLFDKIDRDKIFRTRDEGKLALFDYVCDVGGVFNPKEHLFDHHQASYQGTLSSAGMILQNLFEQGEMEEKEYHFFRNTIIDGVDAHDNGLENPKKGHSSFSNVVSNFLPFSQTASPESFDLAFYQALDFVLGHFSRLRERFLYYQDCLKHVQSCMNHFKDKDYLIFEQNLAWLESFFELGGEEHAARFIVMPSGKHWKLRAIPPSYEKRMEVRQALPLAWAGLIGADLEKASGIEGAIFCHKGRFTSVWESKEAALKALDYVLGDLR